MIYLNTKIEYKFEDDRIKKEDLKFSTIKAKNTFKMKRKYTTIKPKDNKPRLLINKLKILVYKVIKFVIQFLIAYLIFSGITYFLQIKFGLFLVDPYIVDCASPNLIDSNNNQNPTELSWVDSIKVFFSVVTTTISNKVWGNKNSPHNSNNNANNAKKNPEPANKEHAKEKVAPVNKPSSFVRLIDVLKGTYIRKTPQQPIDPLQTRKQPIDPLQTKKQPIVTNTREQPIVITKHYTFIQNTGQPIDPLQTGVQNKTNVPKPKPKFPSPEVVQQFKRIQKTRQEAEAREIPEEYTPVAEEARRQIRRAKYVKAAKDAAAFAETTKFFRETYYKNYDKRKVEMREARRLHIMRLALARGGAAGSFNRYKKIIVFK